MISAHQKFNQTLWIMKVTFGLFFLLAGVDKFFNWVIVWEKYLSPFVKNAIPLDPHTFLIGMGVIEIILGLLFFTKWVREAAYFAVAWLMISVVNLLLCGACVDNAVQHLVAASSAFALARLCEVKDQLKI